MRLLALGDRNPDYLTHREIDAALELMPPGAGWVATDSAQARELDDADGVWLVSGGPFRDDEAAFAAIDHCLRTGTPFLGTCSGFQYAAIELLRTRAGVTGAAHAETDPQADELAVVPLRCALYGERRTVTPASGTILASICGVDPFEGFHYCGYGLDERYESVLASAGVVISAHAPDAGVEGIELAEHPFFVATAFQPQVGASESRRLHPLLETFLEAVAATQPAEPTQSAQQPA